MAKTTWGDFFRKWGFSSIKLNTGFAEVEFSPVEDDHTCAWEMYVELITRITTQPLQYGTGDEKTALESIHSLFGTTRAILKDKGRQAPAFTKIAVIILNQVIRPFTAKWHKKSLSGYLELDEGKDKFREELVSLQIHLKNYSKMLADLAGVEDLTEVIEV